MSLFYNIMTVGNRYFCTVIDKRRFFLPMGIHPFNKLPSRPYLGQGQEIGELTAGANLDSSSFSEGLASKGKSKEVVVCPAVFVRYPEGKY